MTITGVATSSYYTSGCDPVAGTSDCTGTDLIDELATQTDANGNTTTYTEDPEGNTLSVTDPYGNETTMSYDDMGNRQEETAPKGNVSGATWQEHTTFTAYDAEGEVCWNAVDESSTPSLSCSSPPLNATLNTYDADGNVTNVIDPAGNHTSTAFDSDGETCWTAPSNVSTPSCASAPSGATLYSYDSNGNTLSTTDADGNTNSSQFTDPTCPSTATTQTLAEYSSGHQDAYTYDTSCHLLSHTDAGGVVTTYGYDGEGQMTGEYPGDPGGTASLSGISCASSSDCVAGGTTVASQAVGLETTNSGSAFSVGSSLTGGTVTGLNCPNTSTCFAVGTTTGGAAAIWVTTNSGASWSSQTVPGSVGALSAISCTSATKCTAVGWGTNEFDPIDVYTRDGSTWSEQDLSSLSQLETLDAVDCVSSTSCIAVGSDTTGSADVITGSYSSVWNYTSLLSDVPSNQGPLTGVSCSSSSWCSAVGALTGNSAEILATTSYGSSWTIDTVPSEVNSLSGVSCPVTSDCFAVGATGTEGLPAIVATTNGGSSWISETPAINTDPSTSTPDPATVDELDTISCVSASTCYAAGTSDAGSGGVMVTTSSGSTWSVASGLTPETFAHNSDAQIDRDGRSFRDHYVRLRLTRPRNLCQ